jgi:hypothetical protein
MPSRALLALVRRLLPLLLLVLLAVTAMADEPGTILHEYIPPDPHEDVSFAATTLDGDLPAAVQTPSGVATAPDPRRAPVADHAYGGATTDDSPDSTYEPDRDTRRPNVENYDDPFSPATSPFKRLRAYDAVDADYALRVRDKSLKIIPVGGVVGPGDEPFYGDFSVDMIPDQPVRIPTVGPGVRLLRLHANPEMGIDVYRDGADNWFARGGERKRVRLVVELAIPRAAFGSEFADPDWVDLERYVAPQPQAHQAAFQEVANAIGVSRAMRPREALRKLVAYFRAFEPSDDTPRGRGDIYLDLALSKKGVCRHRSFAFLVTALHLGIPARMVVNEAHAWVEAYDGAIWHRIDLGGAAANLDQDLDPSRPAYVPPPDPYPWPETRDSGQDLADRHRAQQASGPPGQGQGVDGGAGGGGAVAPGAPGSSADPGAPPEPRGILPEVTIAAIDNDVRRGLPLHLAGQVSADGVPCPHVRVDVTLKSTALPHGAVVGSLSTDDRGSYDGAVVIPRDFALGDYDLSVGTPGDPRCGAAGAK